MMHTLPWRPIAELPDGVTEALVFDPEAAWLTGRPGGVREVIDERRSLATRHADGTWRVNGAYDSHAVNPTHFCLVGVPDGFPAAVDPAPLLAAEAAADAEARARALEAARIAAAAESDLERAYEAYWAAEVAREQGGAP